MTAEQQEGESNPIEGITLKSNMKNLKVVKIDNDTITFEDIIDIINNNFKEFKGSNEAILHAAEEIIELFTPKVEPEPNSLSAMQFIKRNYPLSPTFSTQSVANIAESFASMRVERAKKEWKEEKEQMKRALTELSSEIEALKSNLYSKED